MIKVLKNGWTWAVSFISFGFMFVPENLFKAYILFPEFSEEVNVIINRLIVSAVILIILLTACGLYMKFRKQVTIKGKNYTIVVQYGNIFKMDHCKKVIPFDECFTTNVGYAPSDINPNSICGQYLAVNSSLEITQLIIASDLCTNGKSRYQGKDRYESGRIVPNQDYLLMAFAKLDKSGLGRMTREEYIECLTVFWTEIDKYYGQEDVCIPILGSGVTRIGDTQLTQQELLDIIIRSYRLSIAKIKNPNKLYIVCRKRDDFSLNKIDEL